MYNRIGSLYLNIDEKILRILDKEYNKYKSKEEFFNFFGEKYSENIDIIQLFFFNKTIEKTFDDETIFLFCKKHNLIINNESASYQNLMINYLNKLYGAIHYKWRNYFIEDIKLIIKYT